MLSRCTCLYGVSSIYAMSSEGEDYAAEAEMSSVALAVIAKPLASSKLQRRLFKLVKKAAKDKSLKRGVKEVVKAIRKNTKGYASYTCILRY